MDRERKSKDELLDILQNRVDSRTETDADHVTMTISWHEPDENGCNWSWTFHGNATWSAAVHAIADELQREYNLVNGGNS